MATEQKPGLVTGVLVMLVGLGLWYLFVWRSSPRTVNPLDELALIRHARVAAGSLVDSYEDEAETGSCDRSRIIVYDVGVYSFRVPDGREFKAATAAATGEVRDQREVEYLPDNPAVNRVRGDGCQSVTEWLWRKVGLGTLLFAMFVGPGICALGSAVGDMIRRARARKGGGAARGGGAISTSA